LEQTAEINISGSTVEEQGNNKLFTGGNNAEQRKYFEKL
jgi:hypothetical protein